MTDIARVAIQIDTAQLPGAVATSGRATKEIGSGFAAMDAQVKRSSQGLSQLSPVAQLLAQKYEALRQQLRAGTVSQAEFMVQQQQLLNQMAKLPPVTEQAAAAARALAQQQLATAAAQTGVASATAAAATGFDKMRTPLQTLAFSLTGLPGPLGRVASLLGGFALGGVTTLAVTGGIAAIIAVYSKLTAKTKEITERTDALIAKLLEARRLETGETGRQEAEDLENQIAKLQATADKERKLIGTFAAPGTRVGQVSEKTLKAIEETQEAIFQRNIERARQELEIARDRDENEKRFTKDELARSRERRDAALELVRTIAEADGRLFDVLRARQAAEINQLKDSMGQLSAAGQAAVARLIAELQKVEKDPLVQALLSGGGLLGARVGAGTGFIEPRLRPAPEDFPGARVPRRTDAQINAEIAAERELILAQEQARLEAVRLARETGALSPTMAAAADGVVRLIASIQLLKAGTKEAAAGIAAAVAQIAASVVTGRSPEASAFRGVAGGATAGAIIGAPAGGIGAVPAAIIGGLIGGVGGLLSGGGQRRQDIENLQDALDDFLARSLPPLAQELQSLAREFDDLYSEARRLGQGTSDLTREYLRQKAAVEARFREEERAFNESLRIRQLVAQGLDAEAAAAQAALESHQQLQDALARGYSAATIEALKLTQALEAQAKAADAAAEAARRKAEADQGFFTGESIQQDIIRRNKILEGDELGAGTADLVGQQIAKYAQALQWLNAGTINQVTYLELLRLADEEFIRGLQDLTKATEEAAEAQRKAGLAISQDLDVRYLQSIGQDQAAADLQHDIDQQREIDRAILEGWTEDQIAFLQKIQDNEDKLRAAEQAAGPVEPKGSTLARSVYEDASPALLSNIYALDQTRNILLHQIASNTAIMAGYRTWSAPQPSAPGPTLNQIDSGLNDKAYVKQSATGRFKPL